MKFIPLKIIYMLYLCFFIKCSEYHQEKQYDKHSKNNKLICSRQETRFYEWEYDLEFLLRSKMHEMLYEPSYNDLVEYEHFLDNINLPKGYNDAYTDFYETHINFNLINRARMFYSEFENYVDFFYKLLIQYIKSYVTKCSHKTYITRIDKITETIYLSRKYKHVDINKDLFSEKIQNELTRVLNILFLKFNKSTQFTKENFNLFARDLDVSIGKSLIFQFIECKIFKNNYLERTYLIFNEYINCYKYITLVPELLTLGNVLTFKSSIKILIIFRLMNMFMAENNKNIQENRNFIIFFILKILSHTYKNQTDFIGSLKLRDFFQTKHANLHFFSWEFGKFERKIIKQRVNAKRFNNQYFSTKNLIHFNVVCRIFIFQHLIFLKFHDAEYKIFKEVLDFYLMIMKTHGCYGCKFESFIDLVHKQNENFML